ncbi:hypothetical protein Pyn_39113 [Prunus yedoensis var. nudiflora]|uniref:Uncharacterized protein n=1 Tax=Prunus yedoensis var. nudiflora TaxID=2094558 RepID=A0A314ZIV5_PRUYE|nr:hypothetical protein Pyn_39113 [Prunus yedoensis var. nudiflora]
MFLSSSSTKPNQTRFVSLMGTEADAEVIAVEASAAKAAVAEASDVEAAVAKPPLGLHRS